MFGGFEEPFPNLGFRSVHPALGYGGRADRNRHGDRQVAPTDMFGSMFNNMFTNMNSMMANMHRNFVSVSSKDKIYMECVFLVAGSCFLWLATTVKMVSYSGFENG